MPPPARREGSRPTGGRSLRLPVWYRKDASMARGFKVERGKCPRALSSARSLAPASQSSLLSKAPAKLKSQRVQLADRYCPDSRICSRQRRCRVPSADSPADRCRWWPQPSFPPRRPPGVPGGCSWLPFPAPVEARRVAPVGHRPAHHGIDEYGRCHRRRQHG